MRTAYVFHAKSCALLLDEGGVCRWVVMKTEDEQASKLAQRCVGAQFVASLDPDKEGLLGHEPTVGKNVIFARVDSGRVALVRFGPIVQVDEIDEQAAETVRVPSPAESDPATIERVAPAVAVRSDLDGDEDVVTSLAVEAYPSVEELDGATAPFVRKDDESEPTMRPSLTRRGMLPPISRLN